VNFDDELLMSAAIHRRWEQYYRPIWIRRRDGGRIWSWNFAAFFLGWMWLTYRQQYVAFLCEVGLAFAANKVSVMIGKPMIFVVWTAAIRILLGLLGNELLFWTIERDVGALRKSGATMEKAIQVLSKRFRTAADYKLW
jgi:hypothetical protein